MISPRTRIWTNKLSQSQSCCLMSDYLSSNEVRSRFIQFFSDRKHSIVKSSPVVPRNDNSLLFTNSGMNQFKALFLGTCHPQHAFAKLTRACNSQLCIRAGGKHNDLDDVGRDTYHHTFFEMLGSWSFGDYFKTEAIQWAWELLVNHYNLDPRRMFVTYFEGSRELGIEPDFESAEIWSKYLPHSQILPFPAKQNFWEMSWSENTPCGPCSEIHYIKEPLSRDSSTTNYRHLVNADSDAVIEIWNLVFMQYCKTSVSKLDFNKFTVTKLPKNHVDTGMGFERLTSILQNKQSNYDTDIFQPIFRKIEKLKLFPNYGEDPTSDISYRIVADHVRCLVVSLSENLDFGNEGREYVLRKICRRALRKCPDLVSLVETTLSTLDYFDHLSPNKTVICEKIYQEKVNFEKIFHIGATHMKKHVSKTGVTKLDGNYLFFLHDSLGVSMETVGLINDEIFGGKLNLDAVSFDELMKQSKDKNSQYHKNHTLSSPSSGSVQSVHIRSNQLFTDDSFKYNGEKTIKANIISKHELPNNRVGIVTDRTNMYSTAGGQECDLGWIRKANNEHGHSMSGNGWRVVDVIVSGSYVVHVCENTADMMAELADEVELIIDEDRRSQLSTHHTATHLLHCILQQFHGNKSINVEQVGSNIAQDKLKFDFKTTEQFLKTDILTIENRINDFIKSNGSCPVDIMTIPKEDADSLENLHLLQGEVYPDQMRIVSFIGWREACCGTHVSRIDQIWPVTIMSFEKIGKDIYRVYAVAGSEAIMVNRNETEVMKNLLVTDDIETLQASMESLPLRSKLVVMKRVNDITERRKQVQKEAEDALVEEIGRQLRTGKKVVDLTDRNVAGNRLANRIMRLIDQLQISDAFVRGTSDGKEWFVIRDQQNRAENIMQDYYKGRECLKFGAKGSFIIGFVESSKV